MDDRSFDAFVKAVATGRNRRALLKGLLGLSGAALTGRIVLDNEADAARRPTPTPVPPRATQPEQGRPTASAATTPVARDFATARSCVAHTRASSAPSPASAAATG